MPVKGYGKKILRLTEEDVNDDFVRENRARQTEIVEQICRAFKRGDEEEVKRLR